MSDHISDIYKNKPVLNKGFVRLVDHLGDDARVVQSARVSYGAGTKTVKEDRALIRYLLRNAHTSPFEQVVFTFHIKMPIFVARQWVRHRTARLNEISARYSIMQDEFYIPDGEVICAQNDNNKQGRDAAPLSESEQKEVQELLRLQYERDYAVYTQLLEKNVAREIARICLPTALYTEMYWQIDLHNVLHFLRLRLDAHAQLEIQKYAEVVFEIIQSICPITCEAFNDYIIDKVEFYKHELPILSKVLTPLHDIKNELDVLLSREDISLSIAEKKCLKDKIKYIRK